jgi:predicted transposase/invertase (TIGR01784 family)
MITDQISKGDKYGVIKKVISIVITNYVLISENEAYHNSYTLCDMKTGSEFTDVVEVDVLELPKLPPQGDGTALGDWLQFLKSGSEDDLTVIAQKSPELKKVVGILMDLSADERTRMLYEAHETARMDEESRMRGAWNKGRVEGEARGRVEGKMEAARAMINDGLPLETVSRYTGIPADELRRHINGSGVKS